MSASNGNSGGRTFSTIPLFCTPTIRRDLRRPSLCYLDVTFLDGANSHLMLEALVFQNYYTASVSINMQTSPTTFVPILENKVIMANPYSEEGAQSCVTIMAKEFRDVYERGKSLRITLFQPSNMWNTFEIRNFVAIGKTYSQISGKAEVSPTGNSRLDGGTVGSSLGFRSMKTLTAVTNMDLAALQTMVIKNESRRVIEHQTSSNLDSDHTKPSRRRAPKKKGI